MVPQSRAVSGSIPRPSSTTRRIIATVGGNLYSAEGLEHPDEVVGACHIGALAFGRAVAACAGGGGPRSQGAGPAAHDLDLVDGSCNPCATPRCRQAGGTGWSNPVTREGKSCKSGFSGQPRVHGRSHRSWIAPRGLRVCPECNSADAGAASVGVSPSEVKPLNRAAQLVRRDPRIALGRVEVLVPE